MELYRVLITGESRRRGIEHRISFFPPFEDLGICHGQSSRAYVEPTFCPQSYATSDVGSALARICKPLPLRQNTIVFLIFSLSETQLALRPKIVPSHDIRTSP